jgi:hypothetical protein
MKPVSTSIHLEIEYLQRFSINAATALATAQAKIQLQQGATLHCQLELTGA